MKSVRYQNVIKTQQCSIILQTTIQRGGITSIIGPNGAGKSTLLSVIGRLLMPESGMVSVNGMDVAATESDVLAKNLSCILRQEKSVCESLNC